MVIVDPPGQAPVWLRLNGTDDVEVDQSSVVAPGPGELIRAIAWPPVN